MPDMVRHARKLRPVQEPAQFQLQICKLRPVQEPAQFQLQICNVVGYIQWLYTKMVFAGAVVFESDC